MRTLDDIIPPSRRPNPGTPLGPVGDSPRPPRPRRGRFPYMIGLVVVLIVGVCAAVLIYYSGASIEITPSVSTANVEGSFTAGASGGLPFQLVTATKTGTDSVAASGTKQASATASGSITIYNTQNKPQKLVANTRFATSAGLIFRIHTGVTVPAGTSDKPGSVVATAYADQPGPTYDVGASSFSVPGLAGTPEASAVYARSTAPMTGGASGPVPVVDVTAESSMVVALQSSLAKDLQTALAGQVPDGYILLPGAATTTYRELPPAQSQTAGKADISVEGTITGVVFPSAALASLIASSTGSTDTAGESVTLSPGTAVTLTPASAFPTSNSDTFSFTLSGTANLVAKIDAMQIATAVAGKNRSEAQVALTNYPEVKRAILVLRPFWRQSFPEDPASISVVVNQPAAQ